MLRAALVTSEDELVQIHQLNQKNLKTNLDELTRREEGFVTWLYPLQFLKQMHQLAPSVIVKDGNKVAGYALTTLKETRAFHPDLLAMFHNLGPVQYNQRPLHSYNFYCMGQICIAKEYRGKNIVAMLYEKHKEVYSSQYEFLLTEISANNVRSLKAHNRIGFQPVYTYKDDLDEWKVVVWNWS